MKKKRIELSVSNMGSNCGQPVTDPEQSWYYWDGNKAEASFVVYSASKGRYITLSQFFLPRDWTELVPDVSHKTGSRLKIRDWMRDWHKVVSVDYTQYISYWPRPRDYLKSYYTLSSDADFDRHQSTLISGWARLICAWLNDDIPEIVNDLLFWEKYLVEEMLDFHWLYYQAITEGVESVISSPRDGKHFHQWLNVASCCVELISGVCPPVLAVCAIDRGQSYPALWAGHQWMKYHHLGSWHKVPKK